MTQGTDFLRFTFKGLLDQGLINNFPGIYCGGFQKYVFKTVLKFFIDPMDWKKAPSVFVNH